MWAQVHQVGGAVMSSWFNCLFCRSPDRGLCSSTAEGVFRENAGGSAEETGASLCDPAHPPAGTAHPPVGRRLPQPQQEEEECRSGEFSSSSSPGLFSGWMLIVSFPCRRHIRRRSVTLASPRHPSSTTSPQSRPSGTPFTKTAALRGRRRNARTRSHTTFRSDRRPAEVFG